jgi:hypothetical protein
MAENGLELSLNRQITVKKGGSGWVAVCGSGWKSVSFGVVLGYFEPYLGSLERAR